MVVDFSPGNAGMAALQAIIDDFLARIIALEAAPGGGGVTRMGLVEGDDWSAGAHELSVRDGGLAARSLDDLTRC